MIYKLAFLRSLSCLLLAGVMVIANNYQVSAFAFSMPPPTSNRQKAHLDVGFTGGGCSEGTNAISSEADAQPSLPGNGIYAITIKNPRGRQYHGSNYDFSNSMGGVEQASRGGYHSIDLDINRTTDGVFYAAHNRSLTGKTWAELENANRNRRYKISKLSDLLTKTAEYELQANLDIRMGSNWNDATFAELANLANSLKAKVTVKASTAHKPLAEGLTIARTHGFWVRSNKNPYAGNGWKAGVWHEPTKTAGTSSIFPIGEESKSSASACICAVPNGGSISANLGEVSKDFSLGKSPRERRVNLIKALMSVYDLSAAQAAGPVGNFMRESSGTETEAKKIPPNVNQGSTDPAPPNSSTLGYSWAQWSGGRKAAITKHLRDTKFVDEKGAATDAGAFSYLKKELDGSYKSTIPELKKQKSPEDAAFSFEKTFENAGAKALSDRAKFARQAFNEYNGGGGDIVSDTADTAAGACPEGIGSGNSVKSANFGNVVFPLKGSKKVVDNPGMFHDGDSDRGGHPYIAYDILAKPGVEVVAFAAGEVTYTSNDCGGKFITIWNKEAKLGVSYMHMSSHIGMGKVVKPGDHVGVVGSAADGCGTPHLHIDAATDKTRLSCSRSGCSIQNHFRSIGKELFNAYQALPNN